MQSQLLRQGFQAHQRGEVDLAKALYQSILSQDPNCADALHLLGILNLQTGDVETAIQRLSEATHQQPENEGFWQNLGNAFRHASRWSEAQNAWTKALKIKPENPDVLANLGISCVALGQREQAKVWWEKALDIQAEHLESLVNLGLFYREEEDYKKAHEVWSQALRVSPNHQKVKEWLAEVKGTLAIEALVRNNLKEASRLLRRAVDLYTDDARNWAYLAEVYLTQKKYKLAFEACQQAIGITPEKPEYHHTMGNIFRTVGQNDQALQAYQRAKRFGSTHPATYRAIAELSGEQVAEDPQLVRQLFNQYAEKFDSDLQENLSYSTPELAYQLLLESTATPSFEAILDLGCGTGLSIQPFYQEGMKCVGVDISEMMIEQARKKNLYTELHASEIVQFLQYETRQFSLSLCLDTLVYIQNLEEIFAAVRSCSAPGGLWLCSTEKGKGTAPRLQSSGRYAHPESYVKNVAKQQKWNIVAHQEANLRKDGDRWIRGVIWLFEAKD